MFNKRAFLLTLFMNGPHSQILLSTKHLVHQKVQKRISENSHDLELPWEFLKIKNMYALVLPVRKLVLGKPWHSSVVFSVLNNQCGWRAGINKEGCFNIKRLDGTKCTVWLGDKKYWNSSLITPSHPATLKKSDGLVHYHAAILCSMSFRNWQCNS